MLQKSSHVVMFGIPSEFAYLIIEVRDSRTGYLVPGHVGPGLRQMPCWRRHHLKIKVDIQARKLYSKIFLRFSDPGERYERMGTGVLLRISIRIQ